MVDWDGLENRSRCKPTVGSNPTPSVDPDSANDSFHQRTRGMLLLDRASGHDRHPLCGNGREQSSMILRPTLALIWTVVALPFTRSPVPSCCKSPEGVFSSTKRGSTSSPTSCYS